MQYECEAVVYEVSMSEEKEWDVGAKDGAEVQQRQ
jgi:hypothetical protein